MAFAIVIFNVFIATSIIMAIIIVTTITKTPTAKGNLGKDRYRSVLTSLL